MSRGNNEGHTTAVEVIVLALEVCKQTAQEGIRTLGTSVRSGS